MTVDHENSLKRGKRWIQRGTDGHCHQKRPGPCWPSVACERQGRGPGSRPHSFLWSWGLRHVGTSCPREAWPGGPCARCPGRPVSLCAYRSGSSWSERRGSVSDTHAGASRRLGMLLCFGRFPRRSLYLRAPCPGAVGAFAGGAVPRGEYLERTAQGSRVPGPCLRRGSHRQGARADHLSGQERRRHARLRGPGDRTPPVAGCRLRMRAPLRETRRPKVARDKSREASVHARLTPTMSRHSVRWGPPVAKRRHSQRKR